MSTFPSPPPRAAGFQGFLRLAPRVMVAGGCFWVYEGLLSKHCQSAAKCNSLLSPFLLLCYTEEEEGERQHFLFSQRLLSNKVSFFLFFFRHDNAHYCLSPRLAPRKRKERREEEEEEEDEIRRLDQERKGEEREGGRKLEIQDKSH